uniref:Hydroxymethylglutaryl-CoA synthase n=1 Tax=Tetraselmis sp. GSL018 TaxID=582737 RepID=A0A061QR13_9CHLO
MVLRNSFPRPADVGVLAIEVYFPFSKVDQTDLERYDGVDGKYTIGLGQTSLSMCCEQEDVVSMSLTVASSLLKKYSVEKSEIGRIDIGTESDLDAAKPVKTVLMEIFGPGSVEGSDHKAACYAGTSALLSAVDWVAGEGWDGRYALVVTSDVALYRDPAARATSGAGAVAMLVGPDAPLPICRKLSAATYLLCLEHCFQRLREKLGNEGVGWDTFDHAVLHHPFNKLVRKAACRLGEMLDEAAAPSSPTSPTSPAAAAAAPFGGALQVRVRGRRAKRPRTVRGDFYAEKVEPSTLLGRECGNMYAASLYAGLASLVDRHGASLEGSCILMYSFGSGAMSSIYAITARRAEGERWSLACMQEKLALANRLERRRRITPEQLEGLIDFQIRHHGKAGWRPPGRRSALSPGTYCLVSVDEKHRREYRGRPRQGLSPPTRASCSWHPTVFFQARKGFLRRRALHHTMRKRRRSGGRGTGRGGRLPAAAAAQGSRNPCPQRPSASLACSSAFSFSFVSSARRLLSSSSSSRSTASVCSFSSSSSSRWSTMTCFLRSASRTSWRSWRRLRFLRFSSALAASSSSRILCASCSYSSTVFLLFAAADSASSGFAASGLPSNPSSPVESCAGPSGAAPGSEELAACPAEGFPGLGIGAGSPAGSAKTQGVAADAPNRKPVQSSSLLLPWNVRIGSALQEHVEDVEE